MQEKRLTAQADESRVCYHSLVESPTTADRTAFTLKTAQDVYYVLMDIMAKREDKAQFSQAQVGSAIPPGGVANQVHGRVLERQVAAKEGSPADTATSMLDACRRHD